MALTDPVSGLISGFASSVGGLIGGIITNKTNQKLASERNELEDNWFKESQLYNTAERLDQNAWNLEMWHKQNEYDSPQAQKQRLLDAGINPVLIGTSAVAQSSPISGASASSVSAPNAEMANVSNPMSGVDFSSYLDAMMKARGIEGQELANDKQRLENGYLPTIFDDEHEIRLRTMEQISADTDLKHESVKSLRLERTLTKERVKYTRALRHQVRKETSWMDKLNSKKLDELTQQIANLCAEEVVIKERVNTEKSVQASNYASANASNASAELSRAEKQSVDITNETLGEQNRANLAKTNEETLDLKLNRLLKAYNIDHGARNKMIAYFKANPDKCKNQKEVQQIFECMQDVRDPNTKAFRRSFGTATLQAVASILGLTVGALIGRNLPAVGAGVAASTASQPVDAVAGVPFN